MAEESEVILTLERFLTNLNNISREPESFLSSTETINPNLLKSSKEFYDLARDFNTIKTNSLKELLIDGFDNEQIWQQLRLINQPNISYSKKTIKQLEKSNLSLISDDKVSLPKKDNQKSKKKLACYAMIDQQLSDEDIDKTVTEKKFIQNKHYKSTIVDDKFFKLRQMEEFLDEQDRMEQKILDGEELNEQSDEDDDDDLDLFKNEDDDESGVEYMDGINGIKYGDFFDPPVEENPNDCQQNNSMNEEAGEEMEEDLEMSEGSEDGEKVAEEGSDDGAIDFSIDSEKDKIYSKYEEKQSHMAEKIARLEESNLKKKEWQLKGETSAKDRPLNSLLEEHVSFDHTSVGAPVITEETSESLEDIIKLRIRDQAWDDVKRKSKPSTQAFEYKKAPELNQEKSKISLAEVYEKEYLKQAQEKEEDTEKEEHVVIRNLMEKLFGQLDALSNFHFTPKPPKPAIKIVTNTRSLNMEEVTPITMSEVSQLAPEEVYDKKSRDVKGDGEKTDTDRKHERRQKKIKRKFAEREKERVLKTKSGNIQTSSKKVAVNQLKKGLRNKIISEKNSVKTVKSSSEFFNKLQTEVKEGIAKYKMKNGLEKKRKTQKTAQFLKL